MREANYNTNIRNEDSGAGGTQAGRERGEVSIYQVGRERADTITHPDLMPPLPICCCRCCDGFIIIEGLFIG